MSGLVVQDFGGAHNADLGKTRARLIRRREQGREWYARNADKKRRKVREWYLANRERAIENSKAYRLRNPGCWIESHRKRMYNITTHEVGDMLLAQDKKCAVCAVAFDESKAALKPHIDHDHATGTVRGLLCRECNLVLGRIEKPGWLAAAVRYLGRDVQ